MALSNIDPRQALALSNYKNPLSETFGSLRASMMKAGYDDRYANSIAGRNPDWLTQGMQDDVEMIQASEANLKRFATMHVKLDSKLNVDIAKLQADVSKFILKTLAKRKYTEDKELEIPNIQINIVNYNEIEATQGATRDANVKDE